MCRLIQRQVVYWMNLLWLQNKTNCACSRISGSFYFLRTIFIKFMKLHTHMKFYVICSVSASYFLDCNRNVTFLALCS